MIKIRTREEMDKAVRNRFLFLKKSFSSSYLNRILKKEITKIFIKGNFLQYHYDFRAERET